MEAVASASAIVGLIVPAVQIVKLLIEDIDKIVHIKGVIKDLRDELEVIQQNLESLESISNTDNWKLLATGIQRQAETVVKSCRAACDSCRKDVQRWTQNNSSFELSILDRFNIFLREHKIKAMTARMQACRDAFTCIQSLVVMAKSMDQSQSQAISRIEAKLSAITIVGEADRQTQQLQRSLIEVQQDCEDVVRHDEERAITVQTLQMMVEPTVRKHAALATDVPLHASTQGPVRFSATDFYFRHQPNGRESVTEMQPKDRVEDEMQYFYIESPYDVSSPWAPLYLRQQLEAKNLSPFEFTPINYSDRNVETNMVKRRELRHYWSKHHELNPEQRPHFGEDEKVILCRRICSLNGYLDLSDTAMTQGSRISIQEGLYRVRWRVQIFTTEFTADDGERTKEIKKNFKKRESSTQPGQFNTFGYRNPLGYPIWRLDTPDFPKGPVLQLSVGYKAVVGTVRAYFQAGIMTGFRRTRQLSDQILLSSAAGGDQSTSADLSRLDIHINAEHCGRLKDKGWVYVESDKLYRVINGGQIVFAISNFDNGQWQGGFRLGGVELVPTAINKFATLP